jgi:tetratricopeptide (TPR) repeat protein
LQATLLPAEQAQLERAPTTSLAAYDLYLSATARDIRQTPAEILKGLEEIEQALMLDPSFALGWTRKANLAAVAQFFDPGRSAEHQATGVQAARRALELDPQLAGAHAALGFALSTTNDWIGGEAAFREARNLNMPLGDMPAYSPLLLSVGNFEYAREVLQETRAVVPQNPTALGFLITANALLGDEAAARSQYEQGKSLFSPWNGDLSQMYWYLGRGEIAAARALDPPGVSAVMRPLFDTPEAALRELRRLRTDPAFANPVSQKDIALWAAYLGDTSLALEAMRSTVERQGTQLLYAWYPVFAEARKLPEFKILLRDLGVVAYWNEYGWQAVCRPLGADDFECQ